MAMYIAVSSCVTSYPVNAYSVQVQSEIDENELQQLLKFSKGDFEKFKTNMVTGLGVGGWSDWKKSINGLKVYYPEEHGYWDELSSIIKNTHQLEDSDDTKKNEPSENQTLSVKDLNLKRQLDEAQILLDAGLITKEEYEARRKKILSENK